MRALLVVSVLLSTCAPPQPEIAGTWLSRQQPILFGAQPDEYLAQYQFAANAQFSMWEQLRFDSDASGCERLFRVSGTWSARLENGIRFVTIQVDRTASQASVIDCTNTGNNVAASGTSRDISGTYTFTIPDADHIVLTQNDSAATPLVLIYPRPG